MRAGLSIDGGREARKEIAMSGLFINYRRDDTAPYAGRIYDFLRRAFPENKVFMDIDTIDPGEDFVEAINQTLAASKIVVAVIGPNWAKLTDARGNRRLDNPDDYVVRELCTALESKARVIPVLVGGAEMPRTETLPPRLQSLARRNAIEMSDTRFVADAERLKAVISRVLSPEPVVDRSTQRGHVVDRSDLADALTTFKTLIWTGYVLGVLAAFYALSRVKQDEAGALLILCVLFFGFSAWFNVMLVRGKNWARMAYIAMFMLSFPAVFRGIQEQSATEMAIYVALLILSLWLMRLMFSEPIRHLFIHNR